MVPIRYESEFGRSMINVEKKNGMPKGIPFWKYGKGIR